MTNRYTFVFIAFLMALTITVRAQRVGRIPERLKSLIITDVSLVDTAEKSSSPICIPDKNFLFYECRCGDTVVGYLLNPANNNLHAYIDFKGKPLNARLSEVSRAEILFADVLNKWTDSAQEVHRAMTAPRFYQYIRQYLFYANSDGDTCVQIKCIMTDGWDCPDRMSIFIYDGDDVFWTTYLNLTKKQLVEYHVNGPAMYFVRGRNKEPQGLSQETIFSRTWHPTQASCSFGQLPVAVKEAVLERFDTASVREYVRFCPKYIWKYRERKNGTEHYYKKLYKSGRFYQVYVDSLCYGYDAKGNLLYVGKEDYWSRFVRMDDLRHIPQMETMMNYVKKDMASRGRDFSKYGKIEWVEQVGDHYVVSVSYKTSTFVENMNAHYTFDKSAVFEGIYKEPR